jgi:hypothetical protein
VLLFRVRTTVKVNMPPRVLLLPLTPGLTGLTLAAAIVVVIVVIVIATVHAAVHAAVSAAAALPDAVQLLHSQLPGAWHRPRLQEGASG